MLRFDRVSHRVIPWGLLGSGASIALLLAGCPDSLTLDPVSSGSATGGVAGGDAGTPTYCKSNTDCATPSAICDTVRNECVQCLEASHCSATLPGTVCSLGACVCPTATETYCEASARCVDVQTSATDCGACGHECYGACNAGQCAGAWEKTPMEGAPAARANHVAVVDGTRMIVWGGSINGKDAPTSTGGVLDLETRTWTKTSEVNAPVPRTRARAVWTGTRMVVWGGVSADVPNNTGGVYDPVTNTWAPMSTAGAPEPRYGHTMIYAPAPVDKVLIWGGFDGTNYLSSGAIYDVIGNSWKQISLMGTPPIGRADHVAAWTKGEVGQRMTIWGGYGINGLDNLLGDGAEYDYDTDTWTPITVPGAPGPRTRAAAAWNGTELIVWGGAGPMGVLADGGRYVPGNTWTLMNNENSPEARQYHTALWIAPSFIVWGGINGAGAALNSGAFFNPATNMWSAKPMPTGPQARANHTAVDVGGKMVIWGGQNGNTVLDTGAIFDPAAN
jgi:hypothetical protein